MIKSLNLKFNMLHLNTISLQDHFLSKHNFSTGSRKNISSRRDLKMIEFKNPTLNIISTFKLSNKKIVANKKEFTNIIASMSYKSDEELNLTISKVKFTFLKLLCLGFTELNLNIFNKDYISVDNTRYNTDSYSFDNVHGVLNKYKVRYFNPIDLMNKELLDSNNKESFLNPLTNNIFIFENMAWQEVIALFRKSNIIVSGGKPAERHILSNLDYLLSVFLVCFKNVSERVNSNNLDLLNRNLFNLFKYNFKDFSKTIKPNFDWVNTEEDVNKIIKYNLNEFDVSIYLKYEILKFINRKDFICKLRDFVHSNSNRLNNFDLKLFMEYLEDGKGDNDNISTIKTFKEFIVSDFVNTEVKKELIAVIEKTVLKIKLDNIKPSQLNTLDDSEGSNVKPVSFSGSKFVSRSASSFLNKKR